jgi:hypothetical protein
MAAAAVRLPGGCWGHAACCARGRAAHARAPRRCRSDGAEARQAPGAACVGGAAAARSRCCRGCLREGLSLRRGLPGRQALLDALHAQQAQRRGARRSRCGRGRRWAPQVRRQGSSELLRDCSAPELSPRARLGAGKRAAAREGAGPRSGEAASALGATKGRQCDAGPAGSALMPAGAVARPRIRRPPCPGRRCPCCRRPAPPPAPHTPATTSVAAALPCLTRWGAWRARAAALNAAVAAGSGVGSERCWATRELGTGLGTVCLGAGRHMPTCSEGGVVQKLSGGARRAAAPRGCAPGAR